MRIRSRSSLKWWIGLSGVTLGCGEGGRDYSTTQEGGVVWDGAVGVDAGPNGASDTTGSGASVGNQTLNVTLNDDHDSGISTSAHDASPDSFDSGVKTTASDSAPSSESEPDAGAEYTSSTTHGSNTSELTPTSSAQGSDPGVDSGTTSGALSDAGAVDASAELLLDSGTSADAADDSGTSTSDSQTATSEDAATSSNATDAGSTDTTPPITVAVTASATGDWVGYAIRLSASGEASNAAEITYSWQVIATPDGSEIDDDSVASTGNDAQFEPDRAGEYVLRVTASVNEGASDTADVTVRADAFDVGYLNVAGDDDSWTRAGFMVRSDGTNNRQVGCYFQDAAASENEWLTDFRISGQLQLQAYFPNDTETAARIAYIYESSPEVSQMAIAGPNTDCGDNPPPQVSGTTMPIFSPNGQRVSVRDQVTTTTGEVTTTTYSVQTYTASGTGLRVVREGSTTLLAGGATWADNDTLVWAESGEAESLVYRVQDVAGAFENDLLSEVILDCDAASLPIPGVMRPVERGNTLFVSSETVVNFTSNVEVWRLNQVAGGAYDCNQDALSNERLAAHPARDFAVSPDGTQLLYFVNVSATETVADYTQLLLVDLTADAATLLSNEPGTLAVGAHFAADGRQIVWTETPQVLVTVDESTYSRPQQSRVMIANSDGANKRALVSVTSSSNQVRAFHTGSNGVLCSAGGKLGAGGQNATLAFGMGLIVMCYRARRRRG